MKPLLFLLIAFQSLAGYPPKGYAERLADAIYQAEGGSKTRYPYGVLSIQTKDPRGVCLRSITNNWHRWEAAGKTNAFVDFMADRWCPKSADPQGNRNWKRNVRKLMK